MATKSIRLSNGTDTLLPEAATSTSNYCKMADGTLIQWGRATSGSISAGGTGSVSVTFTVTFNSTPRVVVSPLTTTPQKRGAGVSGPSTTGFTATFESTTAATSISADWIAIGRWKA